MGEGGEAGSEFGLKGVDGEPGEADEGLGVGGEVGQVGGEFALRGGLVVVGVVGVEKVDPGGRAHGVVELAQAGVAAGLGGMAEFAVVADEVQVEFVALGEPGDLALQPKHGEVGVAVFPIALGEEDRAFEGIAEPPCGDDAFGFVVAPAFEMGGRGLERDKLVRGHRVGLGRKDFLREGDQAVVFVGLEQQGEEQFQVVEIDVGEGSAVGERGEGKIGAAEADLRGGEEPAAGDVGGEAGEAGLEEGVTLAVVFFLEGLAGGAEVVFAQAGPVVRPAPRIEGEIEVAHVGVTALEPHKGPDSGGRGEPADYGE